MDTETSNYSNIAERIKAYYPECEITQQKDVLVIQLPLGWLEIKGLHAKFFIFGEPFDELDCENEDELYERIESFLLALREEEKKCNPIFKRAIQNAEKRCRWVLKAGGAAFLVCALTYYLFDLSNGILLIGILMPIAAVLLMRFVRLCSFRRDWVCPYCGAKLPLETKEWIPQLKAVVFCTECKKGLLDRSLAEQLKQEIFSENEEEPPAAEAENIHTELTKQGKWCVCTVCGTLLLIFALFLVMPTVSFMGEVPAVLTAANIATLLCVAAAGAALIVCHSPENAEGETPQIAVREHRMIAAIGIAICLVSLCIIFVSFVLPQDVVLAIGLFAFVGLGLLLLGVWMLLARKNRSLKIYNSHLAYTTSFGRTRDIQIANIASVRITANDAIHFLSQDGKKLFSIETNMIGADQVLDWIAEQKFSISATKTLERRAEQSAKNSVVSWHEEYRTPLHEHMKAIRIGLVLVILLLAVGCVVPLALYLFADLKISHAIYLTAIFPLPMILYCIVFAPVLLMGDWPAGATDEWKSMHVKFPLMPILILDLLIFMQVVHFWESNILQIVDFGRFFILEAGITAVLIALFWIRTPKRLHTEGFVMMILSLVMLGFVVTYGGNLAISKPVEHYPAVVVDRREPSAENEDAERTLTVQLDDGTEAELNVSERLYDLEEAGVDFVVCQKKNFLGIRMVRLHLPEGTDISALPKTESTTQ